MENKQPDPQPASPEEESIFSADEFSLQGYDRHIRQARNALFFVAGVLALNVIILYNSLPKEYEYFWLDLLIWGSFILGFVFLGFYTKKKPYTAIIAALCLYAATIILNAIFDISSLYKGILLKIIVVVLLVKGINDAKEAQEMQKNFGSKV
jgi:peptidoglycan/LPS O-acetylase OafA/YrhL